MSFSDYLENAILDNYFTDGDIYVKLHVGDPGEDGTANAASETTRKVVATWAAASGGSKASSAAVSWTNYPATETVSHVSLWDASTSGNCFGSGALSSSISMVGPGSNTLTIPSGSLTATQT